jgi:hypothetical protein
MRILTAAAALAGAALTTVAPAAAHADPVCRVEQVTAGSQLEVTLCVDLGADGTTVAPFVTLSCTSSPDLGPPSACAGTTVGRGKTGFVPNPAYPPPVVDPATGSVRVYDGVIGTLWYGGTPVADVPIRGFCEGDPEFCA